MVIEALSGDDCWLWVSGMMSDMANVQEHKRSRRVLFGGGQVACFVVSSRSFDSCRVELN